MSDLSLWAALIGGFIILALAGDFLVSGALAISEKIGVQPLLAGILIVGFGTSAPELFVSLTAALDGSPGIALGNIVGSNIANVWLVLAIPALLVPLATNTKGLTQAVLMLLVTTAVFIAVTIYSPLTLPIGLGFLFALLVYVVIAIRNAHAAGIPEGEAVPQKKGTMNAAALILVGMIGLPIGAHLMVEGGVGIARQFNVSEYLIGLTLLAVGTSLPELGAAFAAAMRRRADMVVGNVIGSNMFNLLGAGGIIALFGPVNIAQTFPNYDYWAMGLAVITLALFIIPKSKISRLAAMAMILLYAVYIYGLISGWNILGGVRGLLG